MDKITTQDVYLETDWETPKKIRLVGSEIYVEKHTNMVVLTKEQLETELFDFAMMIRGKVMEGHNTNGQLQFWTKKYIESLFAPQS